MLALGREACYVGQRKKPLRIQQQCLRKSDQHQLLQPTEEYTLPLRCNQQHCHRDEGARGLWLRRAEKK